MNAVKLRANRLNARRSTGPRSARGKAIASKNARKHGLLSRELVLPTEKGQELSTLREALMGDLRPQGTVETELVEHILGFVWRLRRVERIETGLLTFRVYDHQRDRASTVVHQVERTPLNDVLEMTPTTITDPGRHAIAMKDIARLDALCDADTPALAVAFAADAEILATLMRYETTLRRNLQRALHELERRQAARAGVPVPPPAAVDIDVSAEIAGFCETNPNARLYYRALRRLPERQVGVTTDEGRALDANIPNTQRMRGGTAGPRSPLTRKTNRVAIRRC
jgi:hypothetical protein